MPGRAWLIKWCEEANLNFRRVTYKITHDNEKEEYVLYIYTARPGLLIGKQGALFEKYRDEFLKETQRDIKTELVKDIKVELVEVAEIMTETEWNEYIRGRGF